MQLEGYEDLTKLSRGGMATIYRGHQSSLNRTVAIKFLSAEHLWDEQVKQLFEQESLVIAQLNHPNIINVIDRGFSQGGRPYFVMEYVQGQDLSEMMKNTPMSSQTKILLLMQTCNGLNFAHKNGVIHRDIKPANLLINNECHLKILDFGIAWLNAKGSPDGEQILGTPDYMSPEQFSAPDSVSLLSDIFSLGAIMYHLFIGKKQSADINNWQAALSTLQPKLAELIYQCMQTNPEKRPRSAEEVRIRLLRILSGSHINESQKAEAKKVVGNAMEKFNLLEVIKRDDYGAVYLFEDKSRQKLLVIKKRVNSEAGLAEAKRLNEVKHPNLVKILGTSRKNNIFIVVMQHITGGSLQDRLSRLYAGDRFVNFALQFCDAMWAAHSHQIIHGNLRPSNILFDGKEQIRVSDFGFDEHYRTSREDWYQPVIKAEPSIERDIYSAGAIFYHMLTGEPLEFLHRRIQSRMAYEKLDSRLQKLLRNMLETDSEGYFDSFEKIIPRLKSLKGKLEDNSGYRYKIPGLKTGLVFALICLLGLASYFFAYPPQWRSLLSFVGTWFQ